ncbi:hypothetical protein DFH08DRAFT_942267 [Mycena albidolilacea]|uniref:Uncharacterized protein n=1 Tax=Mycena albidolilacea TaxID=1033008 RepID=A0AAD6ZFI3_9AGAR|nr:hypothetical protein DFH08DRAFT_942267 [Mycena albidolilacea]
MNDERTKARPSPICPRLPRITYIPSRHTPRTRQRHRQRQDIWTECPVCTPGRKSVASRRRHDITRTSLAMGGQGPASHPIRACITIIMNQKGEMHRCPASAPGVPGQETETQRQTKQYTKRKEGGAAATNPRGKDASRKTQDKAERKEGARNKEQGTENRVASIETLCPHPQSRRRRRTATSPGSRVDSRRQEPLVSHKRTGARLDDVASRMHRAESTRDISSWISSRQSTPGTTGGVLSRNRSVLVQFLCWDTSSRLEIPRADTRARFASLLRERTRLLCSSLEPTPSSHSFTAIARTERTKKRFSPLLQNPPKTHTTLHASNTGPKHPLPKSSPKKRRVGKSKRNPPQILSNPPRRKRRN